MIDAKKEKNIAVFVIYEGSIPRIIGKKIFKIADARTISFRKSSFPIIFDNPTCREGLIRYYYFDFFSTRQLTSASIKEENEVILEDKKYILKPTGRIVIVRPKKPSKLDILRVRMMDYICNRDTIEQLLEADELRKNWADIIMGALAGGGICLFIGVLLGLSGWIPVI